jgi:broad specificity phosphatase PhoE
MIHAISVLRHGLLVANQKQGIQGQRLNPLADEGRRQAEALARVWGGDGVRLERIIVRPRQ